MRQLGLPELLIILLIGLLLAAIFVWPWWRIVRRMGFPGWLSLLWFVPIANVILLFFVAFAQWPVLRELEELRRRTGSPSQ